MRTKKLPGALAWGLALIFAGAAACGRPKTVRIAVAVPLTGDMGTEGQGLRRAVELAVEQANASRRFPFLLEAALYDDRADPDEAVNVANLILADPRVVAVVGHYNSGCALSAARVYARAPMAMVTPAATNPEVTRQQLKAGWEGPRMVFRVCPTDDVEGAYAASFVYRRLGKRRMSILHDKTPYGQGLAEEFKGAFIRLGGRIASEDGIPSGGKDFKPLLARLKSQAKPEGIYFGGVYTEAGLILRQMREGGMRQIPFVSGDGAKTPGIFDVAGDAADGAYLAMVGLPVEKLPGARRFLEAYRERYPDEELRPFDHFGYEAAQIILEALERAGPDRVLLIGAIRAVRHSGLLGETVFDEKGDTLNKVITMTRARSQDRSFPVAF